MQVNYNDLIEDFLVYGETADLGLADQVVDLFDKKEVFFNQAFSLVKSFKPYEEITDKLMLQPFTDKNFVIFDRMLLNYTNKDRGFNNFQSYSTGYSVKTKARALSKHLCFFGSRFTQEDIIIELEHKFNDKADDFLKRYASFCIVEVCKEFIVSFGELSDISTYINN